jgi:hypothetical protein
MITTAGFETQCHLCKQQVHIGDSISWSSEENLVSHTHCPSPGTEAAHAAMRLNPSIKAYLVMQPTYNERGEIADSKKKEVGIIYALSRQEADTLLSKRIRQGQYLKAASLQRVQ